ncbi:MAG: winged helix-turn-helix transcriptional regulator [Mesorhizobium sp.]|uniref:IclR family transcriptional regulator n=1 Tax=unclassified Mesorhizobium TaxID=325217 RepID=UPI000F75B214|nr:MULTISPECIES: IclR family transcriptional regulator [unclassified Mesorhizobium]TGV91027.1 IclR family transcriptional regulator [Mesorhizobium sp. M00.F.Ca.ET.158.01.1.1]AZO61439.1 IclR family transcriptional regulator [Mesorhizobium sp. M1A.F.Ca.IN.022.06.1.1]MCT2577200.1 IclR family transcriptional regulator [Mesorhizobium sp. P13.3]MDF3166138.1 IclR family transcriptional regulator [Mesorhizobium sp. P16.1]MDF3175662.1 IclR family transcriptional regulator [Mesorhizobium sp. P17.1]
MQDDEEDRYRAPALDKGLDILELLASVDGGLTQAEIAKRLDRSPNEFYRMLDRLVKRGYVTRPDGDRYSLTLRLFGLGQLHAPVRRLVSYATSIMRELAETSWQANQLVVFDRGSAVVIAQQEAPRYWGISIRVGSHISLFDTGSGHVLLAFRSPEEREMMIAEHLRSNEEMKLSPDFFARLDQVRDRGYEMMASLQTAGVYNLSAPVLGSDGHGIAALTIPYITLVNAPAAPDITRTITLLQAAAARLSQLAGSDVRSKE